MQRVVISVGQGKNTPNFYDKMFKMAAIYLLVLTAFSTFTTANPVLRDDFKMNLNYIVKGDSEPVDDDISSLAMGYKVFSSNEEDDVGSPTSKTVQFLADKNYPTFLPRQLNKFPKLDKHNSGTVAIESASYSPADDSTKMDYYSLNDTYPQYDNN